MKIYDFTTFTAFFLLQNQPFYNFHSFFSSSKSTILQLSQLFFFFKINHFTAFTTILLSQPSGCEFPWLKKRRYSSDFIPTEQPCKCLRWNFRLYVCSSWLQSWRSHLIIGCITIITRTGQNKDFRIYRIVESFYWMFIANTFHWTNILKMSLNVKCVRIALHPKFYMFTYKNWNSEVQHLCTH